MKIGYNNELEVYHIYLEYPETEVHIKASDIETARRIFAEGITRIFDEAVNRQLKD